MNFFKPRQTTDEHLRPTLGKALFRGVVILGIIALMTWIGKFKEPERTAVRNHGLLGWHFSTSAGISSLIVFPDDANDSNTVQTGDRLWIYPPQNPNKILSEGAFFKGPRLTVIADSISINTLTQLAESVDPGGFIHLLGKQFADESALKNAISNHQLIIDTLRDFPIPLPMGQDNQVLVQPFKNSDSTETRSFRVDISSEGFRLMYTNWQEGDWPFSDSTLSLAVYTRPTMAPSPVCTELNSEISSIQNVCQTALWSGQSFSDEKFSELLTQDSTKMVLNSLKEGMVFYRAENPWELKVQKISFLKWDGTLE